MLLNCGSVLLIVQLCGCICRCMHTFNHEYITLFLCYDLLNHLKLKFILWLDAVC